MTSTKKKETYTAEERAAMRARAKELKAATDGETAVQDALKEMSPSDRAIGRRLHALVKNAAPQLTPKTWYGMPAYANKDGKVVCYFRNGGKFKDRYGTFGFTDAGSLDDGSMWPVAYAVTNKLSAADETKLRKLIKKAVA